MTAQDLVIRPIEPQDKAEWRRLWTAYLDFYETTVPEEVYEETFRRLIGEGEFEPNGFLALKGGKPVGLVHYIQHRHCWMAGNR